MALTAVLEFGDNSIKRYSKQYLLSDCRFLFARPYNGFTPESTTRCERIEVTVIAPGKDDHNLIEWFATQGVQSGRIVISLTNDNSGSDTQILYFEEAHCFCLSESYDINASRRRLMKLAISAETIEIDGLTLNLG